MIEAEMANEAEDIKGLVINLDTNDAREFVRRLGSGPPMTTYWLLMTTVGQDAINKVFNEALPDQL